MLTILPLLPLALSPVKLPDTAPAHALTEWLALCASPDVAKLTKWTEKWFSAPPPVAEMGRIVDNNCPGDTGFTVFEVVESTPRRVFVGAASNRSGATFTIRLGLDEAGKLRGLGMRPAPP